MAQGDQDPTENDANYAASIASTGTQIETSGLSPDMPNSFMHTIVAEQPTKRAFDPKITAKVTKSAYFKKEKYNYNKENH